VAYATHIAVSLPVCEPLPTLPRSSRRAPAPTPRSPLFRLAPLRPDFSHPFVARRVRRLWIRGARWSARGGILGQYVEHDGRAQRSRHGLIARRSRRGVRSPGWDCPVCFVTTPKAKCVRSGASETAPCYEGAPMHRAATEGSGFRMLDRLQSFRRPARGLSTARPFRTSTRRRNGPSRPHKTASPAAAAARRTTDAGKSGAPEGSRST
jgi:hypothetical protein